MRPLGRGDCTLEALTPTLRVRPDSERWVHQVTPHGYRSPRLPVETETSETSFMTYFEPNWRDIWDLIRGSAIRVTVNYSLYGPLDVDVANPNSGGIPGRRLDW